MDCQRSFTCKSKINCKKSIIKNRSSKIDFILDAHAYHILPEFCRKRRSILLCLYFFTHWFFYRNFIMAMEPKKNECSPSQAAGQPDFYGISPGEVLYQSGDSFKRCMNDHTETLIQKMVSEKIVGKKFGKAIKGQHYPLDMLLSTMSKMSLEKFVKYLRLLLTISKPEEPVVLKKGVEEVAENSKKVKTIQDDITILMRIIRAHSRQ